MLARKAILMAACGVLASGCAEAPADESSEIIDNLLKAGFGADDITVVSGVVYAGRDAQVSLAASREMLQDGNEGKEQYRTGNIVDTSVVTKICIEGSAFTGVFSSALDLAIQNYNEQQLSLAMARTPSTGCSFTIRAVIQPGAPGGVSGFPSRGLPFGSITIFSDLSTFSVDTIEHVITHEIGHTIGFRHSDYFNRSISCGGAAANEGDGGVGVFFLPGTDTGAAVGGSVMNSCFRTFESGEFTASDITSLNSMYPGRPVSTVPVPVWTMPGCSNPNQACGFDTMSSTPVGVGLSWTASGTVARYELRIADTSTGGVWVPFVGGTMTSWTQLIFPDEFAAFRVRACNSSGCGAFSPEFDATVIMP